MGKLLMMIAICVVLGGTLYFVMSTFLRKLKKIEKDKWGDNA